MKKQPKPHPNGSARTHTRKPIRSSKQQLGKRNGTAVDPGIDHEPRSTRGNAMRNRSRGGSRAAGMNTMPALLSASGIRRNPAKVPYSDLLPFLPSPALGHPRYQQPRMGSVCVGFYRTKSKVHCELLTVGEDGGFWSLATRQRVIMPTHYLEVAPAWPFYSSEVKSTSKGFTGTARHE